MRQNINAYILSNFPGFVIDFATDARLSDPSNTTYFYDGKHLTNTGYSVMAELVTAKIQSL